MDGHLQICLAVERDIDALQWKIWSLGEDWRVSRNCALLPNSLETEGETKQLTTSLPTTCISLHLCRFTMVFSEVPDMSDASHDFIQQYQKEKGLQVCTHMCANVYLISL